MHNTNPTVPGKANPELLRPRYAYVLHWACHRKGDGAPSPVDGAAAGIGGDCLMKTNTPPPNSGKRRGPVIYRRFRRLKNGKVLDAHAYGHKAWPIYIGHKR